MASREELLSAVRTIKEHCQEQDKIDPYSCVRDGYKCPLWFLCFNTFGAPPTSWPDLKEGGGNDGRL